MPETIEVGYQTFVSDGDVGRSARSNRLRRTAGPSS
jgi:hypothetical protein